MIFELVEEAVFQGARLEKACETLGLTARTLQRWRRQEGDDDRRQGSKREPPNKLTARERQEVLDVATAPQYCELSPHQIVAKLADESIYLASESTLYRFLREEKLSAHRQRSRPAISRRPEPYTATGPNQVFSWDITYLCSPVRGKFFYLYLILDVWSRKIMGARVYKEESTDRAAELFTASCRLHDLDPEGIVLHADNGGPMKGSTMLATLQQLGVVASFSRPGVSNDNPYSEALFRTLKYRPEYPSGLFASLEAAQFWVDEFVQWYNTEHLHSALRFVTPDDRHSGRENEIVAQRKKVYEQARLRKPERWTGPTRNWEPIGEVCLNPGRPTDGNRQSQEAA